MRRYFHFSIVTLLKNCVILVWDKANSGNQQNNNEATYVCMTWDGNSQAVNVLRILQLPLPCLEQLRNEPQVEMPDVTTGWYPLGSLKFSLPTQCESIRKEIWYHRYLKKKLTPYSWDNLLKLRANTQIRVGWHSWLSGEVSCYSKQLHIDPILESTSVEDVEVFQGLVLHGVSTPIKFHENGYGEECNWW